MPRPLRGRMVLSLVAVSAGFVMTYLVIQKHGFTARGGNAIEASVSNIGMQLLDISRHGYILPFEVVSILLLAAMIGCIVIAMKVEK